MGKKSPELPLETKRRIGKKKKSNPTMSITDIARLFNVSYHQAHRACKQFEAGELTRATPRRMAKNFDEIAQKSTEELFSAEVHHALAQLASNPKADPIERINALAKIQGMLLMAHLKRPDATIIAAIIRRFAPDTSDQEVINIYKEEVAKCKIK